MEKNSIPVPDPESKEEVWEETCLGHYRKSVFELALAVMGTTILVTIVAYYIVALTLHIITSRSDQHNEMRSFRRRFLFILITLCFLAMWVALAVQEVCGYAEGG